MSVPCTPTFLFGHRSSKCSSDEWCRLRMSQCARSSRNPVSRIGPVVTRGATTRGLRALSCFWRLSTTAVMWPDQALPLLYYMCFPNDEAARDDLLRTFGVGKTPRGRRTLLAGSKPSGWGLRIFFQLYCELVDGQHQARRGGPSIGRAITLVAAKTESWGTSLLPCGRFGQGIRMSCTLLLLPR